MKPGIPHLLSLNGGYVDTAGFIVLHGLFTAHVTGNFVTLGATLLLGGSGAIPQLLALPMFCLVVALARLLGLGMAGRPVARIRTMFGVQLVLLVAGCVLAVRLGPFAQGNGWPAITLGMVLVAAMAVQNAAHRVHFGGFPPGTAMTSNITQFVIDVVDLLYTRRDDPAGAAVRQGLQRLGSGIFGFAAGCAAAALSYWAAGLWCFAVPPLIVAAVLAMLVREQQRAGLRPA